MKNKFMRSVTAMVVAVTMLISSQGVVTSFADGGDYSDMSESSSVQMNEVGNNGTDQSTEDAAQCTCDAKEGEAHKEDCPLYVKPDGGNTDGGNTEDDAAQCTCDAKEGEAHKEDCPLYVKPDGGNTDGGNTEDDAAQCTCGAEEGGPHKEDCPLYVKPDGGNTNDGDTDNGAGEDTDIKSVVDAINALPAVEDLNEETNYEELKAQVASIRAAYDALTVEEKAQVTNYNLLTDIEAHIDEIIKSSSNTISGEGWEWDESTKTLKITKDTGDFSSSTSSLESRPWNEYASLAVKLEAVNANIGSFAFAEFTQLSDVIIQNGNVGERPFDNCSLNSFTIDGFDKIHAYAFQNTNLSQLTIKGNGYIEGNAFYKASLNKVEISNSTLGISEETYKGNTYIYKPFWGANWQADSVLTFNSMTIPEQTFVDTIPNSLIINDSKIEFNCACDAVSTPSSIYITNSDIGSAAFSFTNSPNKLTSVSVIGGTIGQNAFANNSKLESLTLDNVVQIDKFAFSGCDELKTLLVKGNTKLGYGAFSYCDNLEDVTLDGSIEIEAEAFAGCKNIQQFTFKNCTELRGTLYNSLPEGATITLPEGLTYIDDNYFRDCLALKGELDLRGVKYIGYNAFDDCKNITKIIIDPDAQLGYSNIFPDVIDNWNNKVTDILKGRFQLYDASDIDTISPDGWTSSKIGQKNDSSSYDHATQLTKEAKWSDSERTVADVKIKAYYTAPKQRDFVFVVDCTNSMSPIGDPSKDSYAKFYAMQSKLLDVSNKLLTTPGYECNVAFVGYGSHSDGADPQVFNSGFLGSYEEAEEYILGIPNYKSLTNLSLGLGEAEELVESNSGRETTVIFISDATPHKNGSFPEEEEYYGYTEAQAIKATGTDIYGVLYPMVNGNFNPRAIEVMENICGKNNYFYAPDTEGFSKAVNDSISFSYGNYVLTDTVHPDFELDRDSIEVSSGDVEISEDTNGNTVITWSIHGMPFTTHTMTFKENLKPVNGIYPTGIFDTNANDAIFTMNGTDVNYVETPQLDRDKDDPIKPPVDPEDPNPRPGGGGDEDDDTPTIINETPVPTTTIEDEDVPMADLPEDTVTIDDEEVPLKDIPNTGDMIPVPAMVAAVISLGGITLLMKKHK